MLLCWRVRGDRRGVEESYTPTTFLRQEIQTLVCALGHALPGRRDPAILHER